MSDNNCCNGNICGCPDIVNDNLCCTVIVNNKLCLLPPALGNTIVVTFAPLSPANVTIIQNAGQLCVCGLVTKVVSYTGLNPDGTGQSVDILQDIPFNCCICNCDFNAEDPSEYGVATIEVENLCTTLASSATRNGAVVFFCLKETDAVRVRLVKLAPVDGVISA